MAREVLDAQEYPDLRQYPGGPPERPYDAAGWSLPQQMGVHVVAATSPLDGRGTRQDEADRTAAGAKGQADEVRGRARADAAPFDSLPGVGFNSEPAAAAIMPPPGKITGAGDILLGRPRAEQRVQGDQSRVEEGATVQRAPSTGAPIRYAIRGLPSRAQDELAESLALQAERTDSAPGRADPAAAHRPLSAMDRQHGRRLEPLGPRTVRVSHNHGSPEDFKSSLAEKVDVLIMADDARVPVAGAEAGRGGRGGESGSHPPRVRLSADAADLQNFEQFVRGGGTVVCLSSASTFAIQQLKLPVKNVVAGLRPEEFFLRGSIVEVTTDPTHPVMAGMPDKAAVFVGRQSGIRNPGWLQGHRARPSMRNPDRRCSRAI